MTVPRIAWTIAGTVLLVIGILGVILPLLPGTVFLLGASACYLRGSERLHRWLMHHPTLGPHLRAVTGGGMPMRAVVISLLVMWTAIAFSVTRVPMLSVQIFLVILGAIGTFFIIRARARTR